MKNGLLIKLYMTVIVLIQLMVMSINTAISSEWSEMTCETEDYIPISLRGVWGSSSNDVFFVGDSGYIFHYDGSNCYTMLDTQLGDIEILYDVWGSSSTDVFAVGGNYGEILHYDGDGWSIMRTSKEPQYLYGIWGYSPTNVFAVGQSGIILRYDGETWSEMESGTESDLYGIWGSSLEDIFVVGASDYNSTNGLILHYNGIIWTSMYTGSITMSRVFYDVWGSSGDDVFVVGRSHHIVNPLGVIFHYDGTFWSIDAYYLAGTFYGTWGYSPSDVFAVGGSVFMGSTAGILKYNGEDWIDMESEIQTVLYDIWGSSDKDIYAVGFGYRILHYGGPTLITTSTSAIETTTSVPTIITTTIPHISTTTTTTDIWCPPELIYGEHSEQTELLRCFRDNVLSKSPEGQELIKLYYQWSPVIVKAMEGDEEFKEEVKEMMDGVLPLIRREIE